MTHGEDFRFELEATRNQNEGTQRAQRGRIQTDSNAYVPESFPELDYIRSGTIEK